MMCGINDTIQWIDCMQWTFKWHQCLPLPTAVGITQNIVLVALSSNVNSTVTIEWHTISLLALHPGCVLRSHNTPQDHVSICIHRLLRFSTLTWKVAMASLLTAHCVIHVSLQYQNRSLSGLFTFILKGFRMEGRYKKFPIHEATICYKDASLEVITLQSTTPDIASSLSLQHQVECKERWQCFLKILSKMGF